MASSDERAFSFGIEEEYFLVDARTRQVAMETPERLFQEAFESSGGRVGREFLQPQVEGATGICFSAAQARAELAEIRGLLQGVAARHGLAILACGTHPTAAWRKALQSDEERYDLIMGDLQMIGQRNMLCGMHVHVQVPDLGRRIEIMGRMLPYLPLFVALSSSSPFWQSRPTGLRCYRLAAYDELPRTGLPELFGSQEEFDDYVAALVDAGAIPDGSYLWWTIRPSIRFPTLELRAPDCCTRLDDAIAIAALYRALVRCLHRTPAAPRTSVVTRGLAQENKWRAQRYGVRGSFAAEGGPVSVANHLDQVLAMVAEDAHVLGCETEIQRCRLIVAGGTSADRQLALYREHGEMAGDEAALAAVIAWIAETTCR